MLSKQAMQRAVARHYRPLLSQAASFSTRALATSLLDFHYNNNSTNGSSSAALAGVAAAGLAAAVGVSHHRESKTDCFGMTVEQPTTTTDARMFFSKFWLKNSHASSYDSRLTSTTPTTKPRSTTSIDLVSSRHLTGIAHTRWANSSSNNKLEKNDDSRYYYLDSSGKIAVLHNGSLQNSKQLRKELRQKGHVFTRQTDTEVICKLIKHFRETQHLSLAQATEKALEKCQGKWGSLCVINEETPDELVVASNGSPLVLGVESHGRTFISSKNKNASSFIQLKDGEMGILHAHDQTLEMKKSLFEDTQVKLSPGLYQHWTLKELTEQPQAMARALGYGGRLSNDRVLLCGLEKSFDKVSKIKSVQLQGSGTSLFAAQYGEMLMKHLESFDSVVSKDASSSKDDFTNTDGVICISQSGECEDIHRVATRAMDNGLTVMSVVNAVGSLLARTTNLGVYCNAGRENSAASTKAFTTQVTVLALIALWFRQTRDSLDGLVTPSQETLRLKEALMRLPITFGMTLTTRSLCQEVAKTLKHNKGVVVLGKGYGEPVAKEGAFKMGAICDLNAEGRSSGSGLKRSTPLVALVLDDEHAQQMRKAALDAKARGVQVTVITDKPELAQDLDESPIVIPSNGPMTALGAILPLQLIAYEVAMLRGINPDVPRDL